jgi:hypothetical protein
VSTLAGGAGGINPTQLALDASGNVFVAELPTNRVSLVSPTGNVTLFAASNGPTGVVVLSGSGPAATILVSDPASNRVLHETTSSSAQYVAPLQGPHGLALGAGNVVFVAATQEHRIYKVAPAGGACILAGDGTPGFVDNASGPLARFSSPVDITAGPTGAGDCTLYVADTLNNRVRKITYAPCP